METIAEPKTFVINNGNWTEKGFRGYTKTGKDLFVHLRQMESLGIKKGDKVTFPLFALGEEKTYQARKDDKGVAIPYPDGKLEMTRTTALSVFATKEAFASAMNEDRLLEFEIKSSFNKQVKDLGLSEADLKALLAVA